MTGNHQAAARKENRPRVQVKICGLTRVEQAVECVQLGADLIGLIFFPGSPRWVDRQLARKISSAVGGQAAATGVFVNESYRTIMDTAHACGLSAVQLHGSESPGLVQRLRSAGLMVLKALFQVKEPFLHEAGRYDPSAFLLECGAGRLPGGNARAWDWAAAEKLDRNHPVVLAGGLSAENIAQAVDLGKPDAVDVSSGVELSPGIKDMEKVAAFLAAIERIEIDYQPQQIR